MKRQLWFAILSLMLAFGAAACGGEEGEGEGNNGETTCETAQDCADNEYCTPQGACRAAGQECAVDVDCPQGTYCAGTTCAPSACTSDDECAAGNICDNASDCRTGCRADTECGDGERCSQTTFTCERRGCTPNSCGNFQICDDSFEVPTCRYDGSCSDSDLPCRGYQAQVDDGNEYICDSTEGQCVVKPACESDADCRVDIGEICVDEENERNHCEEGCRDSSWCGLGEFCNLEAAGWPQCERGCESDADCSSLGSGNETYVCVDLVCEKQCGDRGDCASGEICVGDPAICTGCTDDGQCLPDEHCDAAADGVDGGAGLCVRTIACPDDGYGDNHTETSPYELTAQDLPFSPTGDDRPLFCRDNNAGEWFKVTVGDDQVVTVDLAYERTAGNLDVGLLRLDGGTATEVVSSARPPTVDGGTERIVWGVPNGGEYLIHVRGTILRDLGNTPYDITIDVTDPVDCADDNFEPNNDATGATALPEGSTHRDLEVCGDDPDFYTLGVDDNTIIDITVQAPIRLGDLDMFLLNPQGLTVAQSTTQDNKEVISYPATTGGDYTLEIRVANGVGRIVYDVQWTMLPNQCNDSLEPNDACANARVIGTGTYSDLNVCVDKDYYAVELLPFDRLKVTATYDPGSASGELQMTLFGPNSCSTVIPVVNEQNVSGSTEKQLVVRDPNDPNQGWQARFGGTYYVLAERFQGLRVPYSLDVEVIPGPACVDDSGEADDDAASATVITRAGVLDGSEAGILGRRICDTNTDWYAIDLEAGDKLDWEVRFDNSAGNIDATLYDTDGTTIIDTAATDSDIETVSATGPNGNGMAAGRYYLKVEGKYPVRNSYRVLTYINGQGPSDPQCPDVMENNDDRSAAAELDPATAHDLLICGGDDDWFKTFVGAGETLTVTATFDNSQGNIDLTMYDDTGSSGFVARSASVSADVETVTYTSQRDQFLYYRTNTNSAVTANFYQLDVQTSGPTPCTDDRFEENDDAGNAPTIDAPGLYDRVRKCEDDEDWFEVELTGGESFEAFINYGSDEGDLDVYVYTASDLTMPVAEGTTTTDDDSAAFSAGQTGTYYVQVISKTRARVSYDLMLYVDGDGPADRVCPDPYENNDVRTDAADLPVGTYSDLLLCWGRPSDKDYYRTWVPAGATLSVDLTFAHAEGNIDVRVYRGSSVTPVNSGRSTSDNESLQVTNGSTGENYLVEVYSPSGSFRNYYDLDLGLQFAGVCQDDALGEATRTAASSATPVGVGTYELTLCEATEDWIRIDATAGQRVRAFVDLQNRLGNIDIELWEGDTMVIASTGDGNTEEIDTNVGASGPYYLRVIPRDGAFLRNDYDLWLAIGSSEPAVPFCAADDPYERNDEQTTAANLSFTGSLAQYTEMWACGAEEDWYQVDLNSSRTYEFKAFFDHAADFDLALEVRDSAGSLVQDTSGTDISFASHSSDRDEIVAFSPPTTGTYLLGVTNQGTAAGRYFVELTYTGATCVDDVYEDNDDEFNRPDIGATLPFAAGLTACGDSDYFTWTAGTDGDVTVEALFDNTEVNLGLIVTNLTNGNNVVYDTAIDATDNRAGGTFTAVSGTPYLVRVGRAPLPGDSSPSDGPYFLTIE